MTSGTAGGLVLIVEPTAGFAAEASAMLGGRPTATAHSIPEAVAAAADGPVDAVLLGPSYAHESAVGEAAALHAAVPGARMVLVAEVPGSRLLRAAMRAGVGDVVDAPANPRKLAEALGSVADPEAAPPPGPVDMVI